MLAKPLRRLFLAAIYPLVVAAVLRDSLCRVTAALRGRLCKVGRFVLTIIKRRLLLKSNF